MTRPFFNQVRPLLSRAVLLLIPFSLNANPWGKDADLPYISRTLSAKNRCISESEKSSINIPVEQNERGTQEERPLLRIACLKENRTLNRQRILSEPKNKSLLSNTAEGLIWFHQNVISPADGPRSHFVPSSSQYTLDAIRKYGFLKGYILGCDRLMRENREEWIYSKTMGPYCLLKYDPVP